MKTRALILVLFLASPAAHAQVPGMAGAGMAAVRGIDAVSWNPANLSLRDGPSWSVGLGSASIVVGNSAFSINDYIEYNGAFLDEQAKQDILASIGTTGWRVSGEGSATLPRFSETQGLPGYYFPALQTGGAAFFGATYAHASAHLTQEAAQLLLEGTTQETPWSLGASEGSTNVWSETGLAISGRIGSIALGASARYVLGHFHALSSATGDIEPTYDEGVLGAIGTTGSLTTRSADGGTGYSIDVGAALMLDGGVTLSGSVSNAVSSLTWDVDPRESGFTFDARLDSTWLDEGFPEAVEFDDEIEPFQAELPMTIRAGVAADLSERLMIAADLWSDPAADTVNMAGGLEWSVASWLPLRGGIEFDQLTGVGYAMGFGLHPGILHLDVGAGFRGGPAARGFDAAMRLSIAP